MSIGAELRPGKLCKGKTSKIPTSRNLEVDNKEDEIGEESLWLATNCSVAAELAADRTMSRLMQSAKVSLCKSACATSCWARESADRLRAS